ncbi:GAF and ANTAR domain-containing protein [Planomonospora venezuelensis]|uniref:GAF domain-containing protein n=1 Tax=Planomonospora venezuelensis TaxID=1999 RepID=A0A841D5B3_PLAVE|nr:GAF and ANTAR domain-containing protein [Planomonospora venezuelensis]MBB5964669.1 GAF domain-containing protein [Planomonospora venezuelensis]GIN03077.1 transcriptional regulator [Planomonospora venezuelensis]
MGSSERRFGQVLVELADTLVDDFDVIDFLDGLSCHAVDLLGVTACAVLLADPAGPLGMVAASCEEARILALSQLHHQEGPCLEAYRGGAPVRCPDLAAAAGRWPFFAPAAAAAGYGAVHVLPLSRRDRHIGAMSLFGAVAGGLGEETAALGRVLADMAAIGILNRRTVLHHETVSEQLQLALDSRILIEQAKGLLAGRLHLAPEQAFTLLRGYARARNLKLTAVSRALIQGEMPVALFEGLSAESPPPG